VAGPRAYIATALLSVPLRHLASSGGISLRLNGASVANNNIDEGVRRRRVGALQIYPRAVPVSVGGRSQFVCVSALAVVLLAVGITSVTAD